MEEEEGSRMVFFGQLREAELDSWSAPLLALRDEGQGRADSAEDGEDDDENDELMLGANVDIVLLPFKMRIIHLKNK